jgi:ABC-type uncharacterized transport system ATPase subunit
MSSKLETSYANAPLNLLLDKPVDQMTAEEAREFVKHLRQVRKSPPVLNRQLDNELPEEMRKQTKPRKAKGAQKKREQELLDEYL